MAEHGLSPVAAILAATTWAAALLGLSAECGDLRAGLAADILIVDADPLADLAILQKDACIRAVVKGGVAVRKPGDRERGTG